jgi:hypothetical protein
MRALGRRTLAVGAEIPDTIQDCSQSAGAVYQAALDGQVRFLVYLSLSNGLLPGYLAHALQM